MVRLGAMGDILHALPAVTALRQAHPDWVIDWVVEPRWRALLAAERQSCRSGNGFGNGLPPGLKPPLAGYLRCLMSGLKALTYQPWPTEANPAQPIVDRITSGRDQGLAKVSAEPQYDHEIRACAVALRKHGGYDAVLDLQGAIRSAVVGRMAGCPRRIGEAEPRERAARWLFTERVRPMGAHVIEQDVELASASGGRCTDARDSHGCRWIRRPKRWADGIFFASLRTGQPAVLINPRRGLGSQALAGGAVCRRGAGADRSRLARAGQCRSRRGAAGRGNRPNTAGAATPLTCSLDQLIALTRRVALVIAGDTGPLHLACALGRPVVGIYGPTDPSRNGPFGTRFRVLRSPAEPPRPHAP